jgi:hypothetical protein
MYHVALAEARQSIEQHGLDWRRLELGSAYRPPGIYLWDSLDFALWYAQAAYDDYDIWAVGIGGLELLPDPGFGEFADGVQHTWLSPQPIAAEQLLGIEASDGGTVAEDD